MCSNSSLPRSLELHGQHSGKARVLIAHPYPIVRIGLRSLLEHAEDMLVAAEASSGLEVLLLIETQKPDVLVMDMELPGPGGVALVKQIRAMQVPVQVLGFGAASAPDLYDLLQSGAAGYITEDEAPEVILAAVCSLAHGEGGWLSRQAAAELIRTLANRGEILSKMTLREREVLGLVATGNTNQHIAHLLGISVKTVEKHLNHLMAKMEVASRVELAVQAVQKGWVPFAAPSVQEPVTLPA